MLSPYRVLDLSDSRGHFAGFVLAQLGAEVIAVEPDEGAGSRHEGPFAGDQPGVERSLVHWAYNRGKKSVRVSSVELAALAATADVVIESGALAVDLDGLRRDNPALVTVSISAFGTSGPKAAWLASDLIVAAAAGQAMLTGDADRAPLRVSEPQAFLHAGVDAAVAVIAALIERSHSGLGQHLDASAQQSFSATTQFNMLSEAVGAPLTRRMSGGQRIGPYQLRFVYPAADGHVSILFLFGDMIGRFTQRLMDWVYESGHCTTELRDLDYVSFFELLYAGKLDPATLDEAIEAVAAFTATKTKAELFAAAKERRLLIAPVADIAEVAAFPQFESTGYWDQVELADPATTVTFPGRWARFSRSPLHQLAAPPHLGANEGELAQLLARRPAQPLPQGAPRPPGARALDGLKVLDFSWVVAGPWASRFLADHGATVIRIETESRTDPTRAAGPFMAGLGGPDDTVLWHNVTAGKHSLQLNLQTPEGLAVARDLVRWADVVYDSFTPGVLDNLGLGFDVLAELNPAVVAVSSSLMGPTGPYADFSGFGNLAAAITGFTGLTGWADRSPAGPFTAYTDYVAPRFAALAILAAHVHAKRIGTGQRVDVSQAEASLQFLAPALLDWFVNNRVATRRGDSDPRYAPHGIYPAGQPDQDRWIAIACTDDTQWATLASLIGHADLASLATTARLARSDDLDALIAQWTAGQDPGTLQELLQAAGVAAHQAQHSAEFLADPQILHRGHVYRTAHPLHGTAWVEGPNVLFSATPGRAQWAGPTLGQHTDHVLRDLLGYSDDQITELVIASALS